MPQIKLDKIKKRVKELTRLINEYNTQYYTNDSPTVSDFEYDILIKELEYLESEYPEFKQVNSPNLQVGAKPSAIFTKQTHKVPMMSLSNSYSLQEIKDFETRVSNALTKEIANVVSLDYFVNSKMMV